MRDRRRLAILAAIFVLPIGIAVAAWPSLIQQDGISQEPPVPRGTPSAVPGAAPTEEQNPGLEQMEKRQALARNADRQKQLVKDTDKLYALATELKSEVAKTNKDTLSIEVIKKADEIEKLARSVREKMKAD